MEQYELIKRTREALFSYCESIPNEDYVHQLDSFGGASMRDLHIHIADCYLFWIGKQGLHLTEMIEIPVQSEAAVTRTVFREVDVIVERFIRTYAGKWNVPVTVDVPWQGETAALTPLWLFTHTITHEFHHKGQIVSISRHLGHLPPDTDLVP